MGFLSVPAFSFLPLPTTTHPFLCSQVRLQEAPLSCPLQEPDIFVVLMLLVFMKEVSVRPVINVPLRNIPPHRGRALRRTTFTVCKFNLDSIWESKGHLGYSSKVLGWTLGESRQKPQFWVI